MLRVGAIGINQVFDDPAFGEREGVVGVVGWGGKGLIRAPKEHRA